MVGGFYWVKSEFIFDSFGLKLDKSLNKLQGKNCEVIKEYQWDDRDPVKLSKLCKVRETVKKQMFIGLQLFDNENIIIYLFGFELKEILDNQLMPTQAGLLKKFIDFCLKKKIKNETF